MISSSGEIDIHKSGETRKIFEFFIESIFMRTLEEIQDIIGLHKQNFNNCEISRILNIPRGTIKDVVKQYKEKGEGYFLKKRGVLDHSYLKNKKEYAYILGMYLGDGSITQYKTHRTPSIRIALDSKWPHVIEKVQEKLQEIFPNNKVSLINVTGANCVHIKCYNKHLREIFEYGKGAKHKRKIVLKDWQKKAIDSYPWDFLRGLIHSDGSRYTMTASGRVNYSFSNKSVDIIELFKNICEKCEIKYNCYKKQNGQYEVRIRRIESVKKLDKNGCNKRGV